MIKKAKIYNAAFPRVMNPFKNILLFIFVLIFQLYWPSIYMNNQFNFQVDIILIYITVLAIIYGRFSIIIVGFFAGLVQDALILSSLGVFSLSKSIVAFCVGSIFNYRTIWSRRTQYLIIFSSYLIHFLIVSYLTKGLSEHAVYILISSMVPFILLIIINSLIFKGRLLSN